MIELIKLSKSYGNKQLFKDFSLKITEKEKVLLNAPSGSGKSTFIKMLLGFEKPDHGEIIINQLPMQKVNLQKIRQSISYISQDTDLPNETLETLIRNFLNFKANQHLTYDLKQIEDYLSHMHLDKSLLTQTTKSLSGGERQRFALVLALILDRPILLLDEVTAGLDEALRHSLIPWLLSLDKTLLIVSHDSAWTHYNDIRKVSFS